MKPLRLSAVLLVLLIAAAYRMARWVKATASQKLKDRLLLGLLAVFVAGLFFCFPLRGAFALATLVAACVAADFLSRKRGSDADQQH